MVAVVSFRWCFQWNSQKKQTDSEQSAGIFVPIKVIRAAFRTYKVKFRIADCMFRFQRCVLLLIKASQDLFRFCQIVLENL